MVGGVQDAAKIPELRRRVMFTIGMLVIYRIGVFVPTPGIDSDKLNAIFNQASTKALFGMVNMFSGGALENFSVFALGIMPYISVSIIIQLLTSSWKPLEELSKEGEAGRRVITRYTRIGTIVLALVQGTMISIGLVQQGVVAEPGGWFLFKSAITLAAGTAFIMWLGEQITERGIGNGISLIIMSGIVARMPSTLLQTLQMIPDTISILQALTVLAFAVVVVAFIVFVETSQRRIPVQYPRRAVGRHMTQASTQHLPLKVNTAGVIPPIFASAFLVFPATIAQMSGSKFFQDLVKYIQPATWGYEILFAGLIIFFAYFYTALVFDPNQIAENLKKNGGFVPTVRPGKDTADFLNRVLTRLTLWGGLYICAVCIIPSLFYMQMEVSQFSYFFGGTAVLIVVGVTIDTYSQIQSHIVARNYEGFMAKGPGKIRGTANIRGRLIQR